MKRTLKPVTSENQTPSVNTSPVIKFGNGPIPAKAGRKGGKWLECVKYLSASVDNYAEMTIVQAENFDHTIRQKGGLPVRRGNAADPSIPKEMVRVWLKQKCTAQGWVF